MSLIMKLMVIIPIMLLRNIYHLIIYVLTLGWSLLNVNVDISLPSLGICCVSLEFVLGVNMFEVF